VNTIKLFVALITTLFLGGCVGTLGCGQGAGACSSYNTYTKGNTTTSSNVSCYNGKCFKNISYRTFGNKGNLYINTQKGYDGKTRINVNYYGINGRSLNFSF